MHPKAWQRRPERLFLSCVFGTAPQASYRASANLLISEAFPYFSNCSDAPESLAKTAREAIARSATAVSPEQILLFTTKTCPNCRIADAILHQVLDRAVIAGDAAVYLGGRAANRAGILFAVGYTEDIFEALDIQDELQTLYTSGVRSWKNGWQRCPGNAWYTDTARCLTAG